MRRHATTAVLFAAVALGFAAVAALLLPSSAAAIQGPTDTPPAVSEAASGFLVALIGPGTDLPAERAEELTLAADRVCEGFTAGVPEGMMIRTLSDEEGLTLTEAHQFVETAAAVHCIA